MDRPLPTAEQRGPGRRAEDAAADEARRILGVVEDLNGIEGTDDLLDRLVEQAARLAGYGAGVLALTLPEAALVGTWNLPEEDRARFRRRAGRAEISYRVEKRRRIRRYAFPGTGICFVPHDADLFGQPVSDAYDHLPRPSGTWHPRDRLFLLVRGTAGREIGLCSLDFPGDGNAPTSETLGPLRLAERLLGIGGNLVEIRLLQDSLRRGEEEMRALVADAPVGMYRRREGELLSVNRRLAAAFGYESPEAMLADPRARSLLEPPEVARALDALEEGGETATSEFATARRDGRPLRARLTARRLPAREYALGIVEDVTEESRLEEHLHRARRLEAVGTLASGIAHDFNNILCGILGYASLLRERGGLGGSALEAARSIEESAARGADLTRRLLGVTRAAPDEPGVVDVGAVLADCVRLARETFDRRIEVELEVAEHLPAIRGRATDLHQAILNLCINARDAMPRGGRLRLAASVDAAGPSRPPGDARPRAWVRVDVVDEGEGMEASTLARIFEPFFTTKHRAQGSGLGLFMVYTSVQAHGGAVDVVSAPGRGSTFSVFLPAGDPGAAAAAPSVAAEEAPTAAAPPAAPASARILVVEDESMIRNLAVTILSEDGLRVDSAGDGEEALRLLEAPGASYDAVILDLILPRVAGGEVFRRLRARHPDLPVILSSGNVDEGLLDSELRSGIAGLLPKPYRATDLLRAVRSALATRRAAP